MHLFHRWSSWQVVKTERITHYDGPSWNIFYRIEERRECLKCGKVVYRIRTSG